MLMLLSPAKTLDMKHTAVKLKSSPRMINDARELLPAIQKLGHAGLKSLFGVSDAIAKLNLDRYSNFETLESKQAALAFDGPAFKSLEFEALSDADMQFAQDHLRILCGLYGVLRPFDEIKPYRLEMSNKLANARGKDLYAFWGPSITEQLNADLASQSHVATEDQFVVNCASQEYFKSVQPKLLNCQIINIVFPGPAVYAKQARGAMCRYIVTNRITEPGGLKGFQGLAGEYRFDAGKSSDADLVFIRGAPSAKPAKAAPAKNAKAAAAKAEEAEGEQAEPTPTKRAGKRRSAVDTEADKESETQGTRKSKRQATKTS